LKIFDLIFVIKIPKKYAAGIKLKNHLPSPTFRPRKPIKIEAYNQKDINLNPEIVSGFKLCSYVLGLRKIVT
tara:strand:+ start:225 stop:440 length:216 start_codon:yes stop_codon:yes gene_type:complete